MDWQEFRHGLEFEDELVFDDEIESVAAIEFHAFVDKGHVALTFEAEAGLGKFVGESFFVGGFEEARADLAMDFHAEADYTVGQFIQLLSLCLCVSVVHVCRGWVRVCDWAKK
jgi:hypothetical protein